MSVFNLDHSGHVGSNSGSPAADAVGSARPAPPPAGPTRGQIAIAAALRAVEAQGPAETAAVDAMTAALAALTAQAAAQRQPSDPQPRGRRQIAETAAAHEAAMRVIRATGRRRGRRGAYIRGSHDIFEMIAGKRPRVVSVLPRLVHQLGPLAGVLISQIRYWYTRSFRWSAEHQARVPTPCRIAARNADGELALVMADAELADATGLTPRQVRRGLAQLREQDWIVTTRVGSRRQIEFSIAGAAAWNEMADTALARAVRTPAAAIEICRPPRGDRCGGGAIAAGIVLSQLSFLVGEGREGRCRARIATEDGEPLIAKSAEELAGETGLTARAVRSAIARLLASGYITVARRKFAGRPVHHFHVEYEAISQAVLAVERQRAGCQPEDGVR